MARHTTDSRLRRSVPRTSQQRLWSVTGASLERSWSASAALWKRAAPVPQPWRAPQVGLLGDLRHQGLPCSAGLPYFECRPSSSPRKFSRKGCHCGIRRPIRSRRVGQRRNAVPEREGTLPRSIIRQGRALESGGAQAGRVEYTSPRADNITRPVSVRLVHDAAVALSEAYTGIAQRA